jgi:hypothetical protein
MHLTSRPGGLCLPPGREMGSAGPSCAVVLMVYGTDFFMATTTRTTNPLPFGDLEPKRFEDLVRQLAYDFKPWRRLEATGRAGSDEGFDARGYEKVDSPFAIGDSEDPVTEASDEQVVSVAERLWLIQCKREKVITPAKMKKHLSDIVIAQETAIYGIVFAAACDFSKSTRDRLAEWCRSNGVSEWQIWGKAELEDMLFQPKNDGLLFAYFGISLTIRRQSKTTDLRRVISIKKKLKLLIEKSPQVLIRDIDGMEYPRMPKDGAKPMWRVRNLTRLSAYGLVVEVSTRPAWLSTDGTGWDIAFAAKRPAPREDNWSRATPAQRESYDTAMTCWSEFLDTEKAWFRTSGIIPYDRILLVDDVGDEYFDGPHLWVTDWRSGFAGWFHDLSAIGSWGRNKDFDSHDDPGRESKFPEEVRIVSFTSNDEL